MSGCTGPFQHAPPRSYQPCTWVPLKCAAMPAFIPFPACRHQRAHGGRQSGFLGLYQVLRICSTRSRAASDKYHRIVTHCCAGRARIVPLVGRFLCEAPPPPSSRALPVEHRVTKAGVVPHTSPSNGITVYAEWNNY
jgi:hypothetical protein